MKLLFLTPLLGLTALAPLTQDCEKSESACTTITTTSTTDAACCAKQDASLATRTASGQAGDAALAETRRAIAAVRGGQSREVAQTGPTGQLTRSFAQKDSGTAQTDCAATLCDELANRVDVALAEVEGELAALDLSGSVAFECKGDELAECLRDQEADEGAFIVHELPAQALRGGRSFAVAAAPHAGHGQEHEVHALASTGELHGQDGSKHRTIQIHRSGTGQAPQVLHLEQDGRGGVLRIGEGDSVQVIQLGGAQEVRIEGLEDHGGTLRVLVDGREQGVLKGHGEGDAKVQKRVFKVKPDGEHGGAVWNFGDGQSFDLDDMNFRFLEGLDGLEELKQMKGLENLKFLHLGGDDEDALENLHFQVGTFGDGEHVLFHDLDGKQKDKLKFKLKSGPAADDDESVLWNNGHDVRVFAPEGGRYRVLSGRDRERADAPEVEAELENVLDEMRSEVQALHEELRELRRSLREYERGGLR